MLKSKNTYYKCRKVFHMVSNIHWNIRQTSGSIAYELSYDNYKNDDDGRGSGSEGSGGDNDNGGVDEFIVR